MPPIGLAAITLRRSSGVIAPIRDDGGRISVRCDDRRHALVLERRDQRLADAELGDRLEGGEVGVGPEGVGRGLDRLRVARREGAERVLDAVAHLGEHDVGHVERVLRDEVDADALRADQADDLLDLLEERLRRVVEEEMRLVEEEDQLRLLGIADLGQFLEQLRQQPQEERRVERAATASACRRRGC